MFRCKQSRILQSSQRCDVVSKILAPEPSRLRTSHHRELRATENCIGIEVWDLEFLFKLFLCQKWSLRRSAGLCHVVVVLRKLKPGEAGKRESNQGSPGASLAVLEVRHVAGKIARQHAQRPFPKLLYNVHSIRDIILVFINWCILLIIHRFVTIIQRHKKSGPRSALVAPI